ncbi:hypothetical protein N9B94_00740 [Verrucomicrobia bacterium]|nr:hypothetical protein [Verrucomicrobiota bacterium]
MKVKCHECSEVVPLSERYQGPFIQCPACGTDVDVSSKNDPFIRDDSIHESRKVWQDVTISALVLLILMFFLLKIQDAEGGFWGDVASMMRGRGDGSLDGEANENNPDSEAIDVEDNPLGMLQQMNEDTSGRAMQGGAGGQEKQQENSGNTANSMNNRPTSAQPGLENPDQSSMGSNFQDDRDYSKMTLDDLPGMTNMLALSDSFEQRLAAAGARSGDVRVSLMWNNDNDLDLHVIDPRGEEIFYQHRRARSGGILDIDKNASRPLTDRPVENVYWPVKAAPTGTYRVLVNHYRNNGGSDPTEFMIRVLIKGKTTDVKGSVSWGTEKRVYHSFVVLR